MPATAAHRAAVVAFLALLGLLVLGPAPAVHAAAYDRFYANFAGEELMRAINLDRVALGLPAYATDATLTAIARDRPATCPSNTSLTIRGRARDMADRGYFSHDIAGCKNSDGTAFTALDLLTREGYSAPNARGEDISSNDFPSSSTSYAIGCSVTATSCHGSTTLPWTVEVVERGFMGSSGHRANLLSTTYTRFGCAAWQASNGTNYYSCYFSQGGSGTLDSSGPSIGGMNGAGQTFPTGSSQTFQATFSDGASLLSDGWLALDGTHLRNWAWDHAGSSASISVATGPLSSGSHTITWWVRDTSTHARSAAFTIHVGGSSATPRPTPRPTAPPTTPPAPTPAPTSAPGSTAQPTPAATPGQPHVPGTSPGEPDASAVAPSGEPAATGAPSSDTAPSEAPAGLGSGGGPPASPAPSAIPPRQAALVTPSGDSAWPAVGWLFAGGILYVGVALYLGRRAGSGGAGGPGGSGSI